MVRESVGGVVHVQKDLTCALTCHWCVRVKCVAQTKKVLEKNQNEVARTKKGLKSAWRKQKRAIMFV